MTASSDIAIEAIFGDGGDTPPCLGKVCAPLQREATSQEFYFWHPPTELVERGQIVVTESVLGGETLTHFGIVDEVFRTSRAKSVGQEQDQHDGNVDAEPPFESDGYNYARVKVLRVTPDRQAAPRERARVYLASDEQVIAAYTLDEISSALPIGLVKNGGERLSGVGTIDLDYLLGKYGAHLLVTGAAGRGAKSSFLMHSVAMLLRYARQQAENNPGEEDLPRVVPIVFNVKNFDLFFLDRSNRNYAPARHSAEWERLAREAPGPFAEATFFAPQNETSGATTAINVGRQEGDVTAYSWSLRDVIEKELFSYLFAGSDTSQANFGLLVQEMENYFTRRGSDGRITLANRSLTNGDAVNTFQRLIEWVNEQIDKSEKRNDGEENQRALRRHATATWQMFYRRLLRMVYDGGGVLRRDDQQGNPLDVTRQETCDPIVIDLFSLAGQQELQRFVVATILSQLKRNRRISDPKYRAGVRYLIVLDELNRFAPRNARDAVTALIEEIAAQLRSSGIILLGAQQQASRVSEVVVANAGVTVLGKTSAVELADSVWRSLSPLAKRKAENLRNTEKLVIQDACPEPMHIKIPHPTWAMNAEEALLPQPTAERQASLRDQFRRR